jgi:hypothetical protein
VTELPIRVQAPPSEMGEESSGTFGLPAAVALIMGFAAEKHNVSVPPLWEDWQTSGLEQSEVAGHGSAGFRFALLREGRPNDPAMFRTSLPGWQVGDKFLTANRERLRIVEVRPVNNPVAREKFDALWVVERLG